jgi:hypothetical protein
MEGEANMAARKGGKDGDLRSLAQKRDNKLALGLREST